jgi:hypothetical protein
MFRFAPTCLLFGIRDSTGPKGGSGSKFQRAIVSEIVGHNVKLAVKVGSRIDPAAIERDAAVIYQAADSDEGWTLESADAKTDKGKPLLLDRTGEAREKGRPSQINHGNVIPPIDRQAAGVLIDHATQILVLSLAALRKLRFTQGSDGTFLDGQRRRDGLKPSAGVNLHLPACLRGFTGISGLANAITAQGRLRYRSHTAVLPRAANNCPQVSIARLLPRRTVIAGAARLSAM